VVLFLPHMQRKPAKRDVVASTPYRPPVPAATRTGGRKAAVRMASAGLLVGMTIVAGVAVLTVRDEPPVEVTFTTPAVSAPAVDTQLVIDREARRVTLMRDGDLAWRGRGPIDCVSGRRWTDLGDRAALVARACVRLRDGAVVALAGRVPAGAPVRVR
jgi:hypothetical protein